MNNSSRALVGRHLVRYGFAGDEHFLVGDFLDTYDQLVINATMVAHIPAGLAAFLVQRAKGKPYFIDPQTHAFQHDVSNFQSESENREGEIKIKRPVAALIRAYGDPIETTVSGNNNPVLPGDFQDDVQRKEFCERVIRFQLDSIPTQSDQSDSAKYMGFLKKKGLADATKRDPALVIAPYFYLTSNTFGDWLEVNLKCLKDSMPAVKDVPLAAQIVISRDVLANEDQREKLASAYSPLKLRVLLLWVDSFPEDEASEAELRCFKDLIERLGRRGAKVANLYGGFFSVALSRTGLVPALAGVTHGLEYGEDRPVTPVGGGFPIAKFYVPALHSRVPFRQALRAVEALRGLQSKDEFHQHVCKCPECQKVIRQDPKEDFYDNYGRTSPIRGGREIPTQETKEHCVRHYMWAKQSEYETAKDPVKIASDLRKTAEALERRLGSDAVAHCRAWAKILTDLAEKR